MLTKKESFIQVINENKNLIFKVCNSYCNHTEDKKDLAQDIIVELWRSFDKYDPHYRFTTWMYRIAINVAISYYRKSQTKKKHISTSAYDFVHIADDEIPENVTELKLLDEFIGRLDELSKALMILYLEGRNHNEIAEILNITPSNVGTKIGRIKKKLKSDFKNIDKQWN